MPRRVDSKPLPPLARPLCFALTLLLSVAPLGAQAGGATLPAGARVRVRAAGWDGVVVGTVVRMDRDSLRVAPADEHRFAFTVPVASVTLLERSRGPASPMTRSLMGATLGAAVAGAGALAVAAGTEPPSTDCGGFTCAQAGLDRNGERRQSYAFLGAVAGFAVGALVGAKHPGERWERVLLPPRTARVDAGPRGELRLRVALAR